MRVALQRGVLSGFLHRFGKPARVPPPPRSGYPARGRGPAAAWLLGLLGALVLSAGCGNSDPGRRQLLQGLRWLEQHRPGDALAPLQAAALAFGTNTLAAAQAWNYYGLACHRAGRPTEAVQAYQAALARDPNLFAARYNLGALHFEQGNLTAALHELISYTRHQPDDPAGWLLLGRTQLRAGQTDAADRNLLQALRLNPSPRQRAEALNALGLGQVKRRRAREAFQYFEAALNSVSNYPPALLNQAVLSHQVQDRSFALQKFTAYLGAVSNAPEAGLIRELTNQLAAQLLLTARPNGAPAPPAPTAAGPVPPPSPTPTSAPPVVAVTAAPPASPAHTPAPPAEVRAPTPPAAGDTSPPPSRLTQTPPSPAREPETAPALRPAPPPSTNQLTATPAPPGEPQASARSEPRGTQAPQEPAARPATATSPPPIAPVLETVVVEPEPEIKPAVDLVPPSTAPATAEVPPAPAAPAPEVSNRAPVTWAEAAAPAAAEEVATPPRKRSLLARLNPLNLLRKDDHAEEKAREREAAEAEARARKAEKETRLELAPTPIPRPGSPRPAAATPPEPPRPQFPRYTYRRPAAPPPGNRIEAERLVGEGVAAHRAGRLVEARAWYARAAQADPAYFPAHFNLAVAAFESQDWPAALRAYEQALALAPEEAQARYGFALTLDRAGYPLDAAEELNRLLRRDPRHVEAHLALANLYATVLADPARAREHYLQVLRLQPAHPQAGPIKRWLGPAAGTAAGR